MHMIYMGNTMLKGFPHIIGDQPRILILGSMPSVQSLKQNEYYAHPTNRFWRILSSLYQVNFHTYEDKVQFLKANNIALWDVVDCCERDGSLDTNIKKVILNPIDSLLEQYSSIQMIYCNGRKAYELLRKNFPNLLTRTILLPSTSSANQSKNYQEILKEWSIIHDDK